MGNIKISVIVPVFNTEEYLEDALNSVINQNIKEIEIIVVNDGSTDKSLEIAEKLASSEKRISIISQKNKGLSEARNTGIKAAKGQYLYFMDSDDLIDRETLASCYERCEQLNLDITIFDAEVFGDTQTSNELTLDYDRSHVLKEKLYTGKELLDTLLTHESYFASACLYLVRRSFLKGLSLFFHPGIIHEDELFTFQLFLLSDRVSYIPRKFFHRRIRPNSIMTFSFSRKNINAYFLVITELRKLKKEISTDSIIDIRIRSIVNGVFYNSRNISLKDRIYVLTKYGPPFLRYISPKNFLLLLFPVTRLWK